MHSVYLKGGIVVDTPQNILIENDLIKEISCGDISLPDGVETIDCNGLTILPGVIDVHVHFREPGMEDKADMSTESMAALAGGVTTVLDMPNSFPACINEEVLEKKLSIARQKMHCNYAFYLGVTNNNVDEVVSLSKKRRLPLKIFLGSSTGNLLTDRKEAIEILFSTAKNIVVAHCEDEHLIRQRMAQYDNIDTLPYNVHSLIRNEDVCYESSKYAINLAKKYATQFHLAHISSAKELSLLESGKIENKHITAEVTPNHLFFYDEDYKRLGNMIKCNPAIKSFEDRKALRWALKSNLIDIVSTDHAPHLLEEKRRPYFSSPSGIPSIQFSLLMMLEIMREEHWNIGMIAEKMCTNPARRFGIERRGEIKKGNYADFVIVDLNKETTIGKDIMFSKCKWSPLEDKTFHSRILTTILNGKIAYNDGKVVKDVYGREIF